MPTRSPQPLHIRRTRPRRNAAATRKKTVASAAPPEDIAANTNPAAAAAVSDAKAATEAGPIDREVLPERPTNLYEPGCGKALEAWGVTRQFDFGQFVMLYASARVNGVDASVPVVVFPDGSLNVVESPDEPAGTPAGPTPVTGDDVVKTRDRSFQDGRLPAGTLAERAGGIPLNLLLTHANPLDLLIDLGQRLPIDIGHVLAGRAIATDAGDVFSLLDDTAVAALVDGKAVRVIVETRPADGSQGVRAVRTLEPMQEVVDLDEDAIDTALATGDVTLPDGLTFPLERNGRVDAALRSNRPVTITIQTDDNVYRHLRLQPALLATSQPMAGVFKIDDPSTLLRYPYLPAVDGTPIPVTLTAAAVQELRTRRQTTLDVNGVRVQLQVVSPEQVPVAETGVAGPPGRRARSRISSVSWIPSRSRSRSATAVAPFDAPGPPVPGEGPGGGGGGIIGTTPDPSGGTGPITWPGISPKVEQYLDWRFYRLLEELAPRFDRPVEPEPPIARPPAQGLPVALFLPWRQQWRFVGLSRGNLLTSVALAPSEVRTIRTFSWERRSKALEQSTETETEMQQDYTSTTRDTEDVFSELTNNQQFNSQVHADVDASYTPVAASISVSAGVSQGTQNSLQQVARSTTQHMTETVHRASARVRSRRITKITESTESVSGEDVVRTIRNANECRTLTLDYYEQLAHYEISTGFRKDRVRVVVMVKNPLANTTFTNDTVRTNETALRQSLLNPELGDGFAAARLLSSYGHAWVEAEHIAKESKRVAELDRERPKDKDVQADKPQNPHTQEVIDSITGIREVAEAVVHADITHTLKFIGAVSNRVAPDRLMIDMGKRWLWRTVAEAKIGGQVTEALSALTATGKDVLTVEHAKTLMTSFPAGSAQELQRLASLPDTEKEKLALGPAIHGVMAAEWDWAWWSGACRERGLYTPNDNGISGRLARLTSALTQYEAKEAEGAALLAQQEMDNKAKQEQAQANWVDKLEMKYGLDVVADARERQEALLAHLNTHADYYRYVLFQALPPGEQLAHLTKLAPQLRVGHFEPRVVAYNGDQLALPLTPIGQTALAKLVDGLANQLDEAAREAQAAADAMFPDDIILPTPGLTVETSLGGCSGCEPHRRHLHKSQRRVARARAQQEEAEVARREARLAATPPELGEFAAGHDGLRVLVDRTGIAEDLTVEPGGDTGTPPPSSSGTQPAGEPPPTPGAPA